MGHLGFRLYNPGFPPQRDLKIDAGFPAEEWGLQRAVVFTPSPGLCPQLSVTFLDSTLSKFLASRIEVSLKVQLTRPSLRHFIADDIINLYQYQSRSGLAGRGS